MPQLVVKCFGGIRMKVFALAEAARLYSPLFYESITADLVEVNKLNKEKKYQLISIILGIYCDACAPERRVMSGSTRTCAGCVRGECPGENIKMLVAEMVQSRRCFASPSTMVPNDNVQ